MKFSPVEQVLNAIDECLDRHDGESRTLLEALVEKAAEWQAALKELQDED